MTPASPTISGVQPSPALDAAVDAALPRTGDRTSRMHLQDARAQIERILHPEGRR